MESAAELLPKHNQTASVEHHGTLLSNSISPVQSTFNFNTTKETLSSHQHHQDPPAPHLPSTTLSGRDLPSLGSKDSYLQFSGVTSQPHSVIVENGLFARSDPNLIGRGSSDFGGSGQGSDFNPTLQPPLHSANATPMCIKRGPGRPRKDGAPAPKCSNSLNKFKKFCSNGNYMSGNVRGVRGRKKTDGSSGSFANSSGSLSDLASLDGETPTFTEDTMESDTSSVASSFDKLLEDFTFFPEQWPGKLCAFCNLSEKSMSGQGELVRIPIPAGFDPVAVSKSILFDVSKENPSDKIAREGASSKRPKSVGKTKRLTSQGSLESINEPVDEVIGYPEEIDVNTVFDVASGHYFVHMGCALWCRNVSQDGSSYTNLEIEIVRALSQRCSHCGNLGAGLCCSVAGCSSQFHLPCAATSCSFQDSFTRTITCSSHLDRVVSIVGNSANCTVCDEHTNLASMIMCSNCGHHYHISCMALSSDPNTRAGWQCPACKVCQACRQPGDEGKLIACEACDKAYHIFCLRPALSSIPKHSWKCKICRICSDCGARTPGSGPSSRWHGNFSVCDSCYQQRNKGLACPLCGKAYRHVAQKLMLQCHLCKKYVHSSCDPNADLATYQQRKELYSDYEYTCIPCKAAGTGLNTSGCNPRVVSAIKKASDKEILASESNSLLSSNFTLSQDSLIFMEEDSLAGTESSIDLIWSDKTRISTVIPEELVPPQIQPQPPPKLSPPPLVPPAAIPVLIPPQPKKRNGAGRPKSTDKNSSSEKSIGKKKSRMTDIARKRGPKPKMRGIFGAPGVGLQRPVDAPKGEEEPGVENRLVLCSSKDVFVLQQDVCVMCGAFGNDLEGRLISCAQCGQCYHPYCVNVKVNKVLLQKGWRCLDCTVCEGCGQRHDEARLLLCDDCDISFHIYCMNPPLDYVPQGNWKCKWCAVCQLCGNNDPGTNSSWHKNYTMCGPCFSLQSCPVCLVEYVENELVIQCQSCDRWLHGSCDVILNEDEAEKCAEYGYQCVLCRLPAVPPPHLLPPPPVVVKPSPKSPELSKCRPTSHYTIDGVTLSSAGLQHIRSLSLDQPKKKRKKTPNIADMEAGILAAIESVVSGSTNNSEGEDGVKSEEKGEDSDKGKDGKKRGRNSQKFGVGGFVVRLRGPRFKDEELETESQNGTEVQLEKPKRKPSRRKVKNKLVESFPAYLQDAFFGKSLMELPQIKESERVGAIEDQEEEASTNSSFSTIKLSPEELKILENVNGKRDAGTKVIVKKEMPSPLKGEIKKVQKLGVVKIKTAGGIRDILPLPGDLLDNDLVDTIMSSEIVKVPPELDEIAVNSTLVDDGGIVIDNAVEGGPKDELTDFLSSIDTGLPSMDSKDVEDIFKGVLTDEPPVQSDSMFPMAAGMVPPQNKPIPTTPSVPVPVPPGGILIPPNIAASTPPVQGSPSLSRSTSLHNVPQGLASPLNFPPPSPYHSEYSNSSPQFSPAFSEPPSPWPAQVDGEVETPGNYSQRNILKWEVDEALGSQATISAVLYANMNHTELRRDYPNWNERSKQISKIWRSLSTEKKAPYLQKARENRAASRMQKAQQIPIDTKGQTGTVTNPTTAPQQLPEEGSKRVPTPTTTSADHRKEIHSDFITGEKTPAVTVSPGFGSVPPNTATSAASSSLTLSQPHRCFIVHINTSPVPNSKAAPQGLSQTKVTKVITATTPPPPQLPKETPQPKHSDQSKCSVADQQIRVLTPSEIMRTLPAMSQGTCGFPLLDQEKLMPSVKAVRGETQEERHWKQLQAYRQQQAQQQQLALQEQRLQGDPKDHHNSGKHPYSQPAISMVHRQISGDMNQMTSMDHSRQPLQVTTTQHMPDNGPGSRVSPHLQSASTRQSFSNPGQPVRIRPPALEMPPPSPSPLYSPKPGIAQQQHSPLISRSPMYSRIPYMHSPRQPMSSPNDPYGNPPLTPQPDPYSHPPSTPHPESDSPFSPNHDTYGQKMMHEQYVSVSPNEMDNSAPLSSPRGGVPQGQETRQHLRDLLQRQQIKKLEQEHSPGSCDRASPSAQRVVSPWPQEDWQKVTMEGGGHGMSPQKHNLGPASPISQMQTNQFRHPFLPQHNRMGNTNSQQVMQRNIPGNEFRPMGPHSPLQTSQQSIDPRMRVLLQHQQQTPHNQQQRRPMSAPLQQGHVPRNPGFQLPQHQPQNIHPQQHPLNPGLNQFQVRGVPYEVMRNHQRMCQINVSGDSTSTVPSSSMLAQQLGRPLNSNRVVLQPTQTTQPNIMPCSNIQLLSQPALGERVGTETIGSSDHQELPESVTAELEKLEEEQHRDGGVESDSVELADLGMDDDDLLSMGADFNILEYADPELNIVVGGEKTNILDDNLDLEEEKEEDKDEKDLKRKEEEEKQGHAKKETSGNSAQYGSIPVPSASSQETLGTFATSQSTPAAPKSEFVQQPAEAQRAILRPPQPPPPYPGLPPPYPGPGRQQQVGIRNGGGLSLQPVPPVMNMSMIFKNSVIAGGAARRPQQQLLPIPSHSPNMPANQRRTLLLQEQPLLLEDLLEQEKREQQRQGPMLINAGTDEPLLSDFDFERLKADVLSSNNLPTSLSPPNLPGQGMVPPPTQQTMCNRPPNGPGSTSGAPQQVLPTSNDWSVDHGNTTGVIRRNTEHTQDGNSMGIHPAISQAMPNNNSNSPMRIQMPLLPAPPVPPDHPTNDQERQMQIQYEQWICHQQQILYLQQKYYDEEVSKLRKIKKSLNSKQRQLRKNGSELNENDAMELERVVKELSVIQKQLDQARKQNRQHGTLLMDYKNKQQKRHQMLSMSPPMGTNQTQAVRQNIGQNTGHQTQLYYKDNSHHHQSYGMHNTSSFNIPTSSHGDTGGGGGGSSQIIPYPTFSWYADPNRLGLKGGSPFSVVNGETHSTTLHPEQNQSSETAVEIMAASDPTGMGNPSNGGGTSPMGTSTPTGTLAQVGESQNALLKQLLQNTGCASTSQPSSESARFSLSNCLPTRPVASTPTAHTSQLSEAATRIPQPTSISRPPEPVQLSVTPPPQKTIIKTEPVEISSFGVVKNTEKMEEASIKEEPQPPDTQASKELIRKDFSSTLVETINVVASDQTALDPSIYESRRAEDEAKKARRRQYQPKRKISMGKEPQTPRKRPRKGSKLEEDYELYLETLMSQLRQLPPIGIAEPELGRNYNICGVPGMGDMSKLHGRNYNKNQGDLLGEIGNSRIRGESDYYNTFPFGTEDSAEREKKPPFSTQRGFYNQEFASPRMGGIYCDRESSRSRSPSPGRERDTPDTIVSSSSPEPATYDRSNPYAGLKHIGANDDAVMRCTSPVYEILRPIPLRPVPPRFDRGSLRSDETDKENKSNSSEICFVKSRTCGPLRENGNVTVSLTLACNAVDDISGILRNLANILSIPSSPGYQVVDQILTPPNQKLGSYTYRSKDGKETVDIQSILNGAAKFCKHCDIVVLNNIIRKKPADLPGLSLPNKAKEENADGTEDFYFCSSACLMQFSMTHGITIPSEDKVSSQLGPSTLAEVNTSSFAQAGAVVKHPSESDPCDSVKDLKLMKEKLSKTTKDILEKSKSAGAINRGLRLKSEVLSEDGKRWKGIRYKAWAPTVPQQQHGKYKKPTEKELTELLFRMAITVSPPKIPEDSRQCLFCHQFGDSVSDGPARLLNLDVDKWVHLNCVLWSDEVYETENGALVNAEVALKQSLNLECIACGQKGATVKCFKVRCSASYHLGCAVKEGCVFYKNKTVFCSAHILKSEKDNELTTLAVFRRVYIQRDENRQVAAVMHHADQHHLLRVGSLIFLSVGQLLPHQLPIFHTRNYIYPIGYKIVRFYWSMFKVNKRCQYICSIHEVNGKPEFRITVEEAGTERVITSSTCQGAWHQVLDAVIKLRATADSIKVFPKFITGEDLFGLTEPAIVKVLESLPGVETLTDYHFKYGRNPLLELPLAINPTGCARAEPKLRTHFKRPHTQRTLSSARSSSYTPLTPMSSSDAACPYSKQFVHSKSSQYRKMKQDWRNNVYLARSKIQGLGLYAARDIEKHTMVIEYIGEIIRSELAELREKRYEAQNRGIYMFRVDENRVIDATLCGGLARYINHSCNPNCVAEQVEVERDIRIIIFTNRRICRGEELSYDYKFEFEDDQHKIPCLCGAPNCRQWMN